MDNYIVSARKYRPVTFRSVVGQELITNTLKNAIRNKHVAQAYLFCGPRGVGKTTCARILAKTINCFNISEDIEPCNTCESCKSFNENASFNIHELDAASNNGVDEIRALIDQVRFAPQVGKYSIYIIDEVHMLSANAFNAFLKTLEEPPPHAIFILATTERHKILPTILSRCQVFTFNRINVDDIANHLKWVAGEEKIEAEPEALHVIAQKADGGLRDALSMFDQIISYSGDEGLTYQKAIENLNVLDYEVYFKLVDNLWQGNYSAALIGFDEVLSNGFDGGNFIAGLAEHFRNLLVCQDAITLPLLETSDGVKSRYQTQAVLCKPIQLIKALSILSSAEDKIKSSRNQRLLIELTLLHISQINQAEPEKKNPEPNKVVVNQPTQITSPEAEIKVEAPKPQVTMNLQGLSALKTVSIKNSTQLNKTDDSFNESSKKGDAVSIVEDLPEDSFDEQDMLHVWKQYSEKLMSERKMAMAASLTLSKPALKNGNEIHFKVQNESQLKEIESEKADLMSFVRRKLKNYSIKLMLEKSEAPLQTRPYTSEEKLKAMEEHNPQVTKLKDRLGLMPE
ncbi:MAG: DNA polymerase III subunit gamma/tau [Bacteroidia bacterium]